MSQDLRYRTTTIPTTATTTMTPNDDNDNDDELLLNASPSIAVRNGQLGAMKLIENEITPQYHGIVLKLHVPILYSLMPLFIQNLIRKYNCFQKYFNLQPQWKQRYLIVCGSYIYKYKTKTSKVPKGSPFDIEHVDVQYIPCNNNNSTTTNTHGMDTNNNTTNDPLIQIGKSILPNEYNGMFRISTFLRTHYYATIDDVDAQQFILSIKQTRQDIITRNMGHANHIPYPKTWKYFDRLGNDLIKSKERIKQKMEQYNQRELEMTQFALSTGGMGGIGGGASSNRYMD